MASKKPNIAPVAGGLLPAGAGLSIGAGASLLGPGVSTLGAPGAALIDMPEEDSGPLVAALAALPEGATDEERAQAIMNHAKAVLTNQEQRESQRVAVELANDTEYWFAVYFQDRGQKEAFLRAIGYGGPEDPDKYFDGQELAKTMGIKLPPRPAPFKVGRTDKRLKDMT